MARRSAGMLPFRRRGCRWQVLLTLPGGPFWACQDLGAWSMAKGEYREPETALHAAFREFRDVGADSNLSHRADPILSQGWKPTLRRSAVDKCRSLPGSLISSVVV
jgi:hypothetical protein